MKPLLVLIISFLLILFIFRMIKGYYNLRFSGRLAMAIMLLFTAIGHFLYVEGMSMMLPDFIPFRQEIIILTGLIEIIFGIMLMIPKTQKLAGWLVIIFFITILPANIYAAIHHIDFESGNTNGEGPNYLWFRVPLQILFLTWVYIVTGLGKNKFISYSRSPVSK